MTQGIGDTIEGTCLFCDHVSDVTLGHKQLTRNIARMCQCCIYKLNLLAKNFGNHLGYWIPMVDDDASLLGEEQEEAPPLEEGDAGAAVMAAMEILRKRYAKDKAEKEEADAATQATDQPDDTGPAAQADSPRIF